MSPPTSPFRLQTIRSAPGRFSLPRRRLIPLAAILCCLGVVRGQRGLALAQCYVITDVGTLVGATDVDAREVNNAGSVVGWAYVNSTYQGFLYINGVMINLGSLGGQGCVAQGINDAGQIVGAAVTAGGEQHAFLYTAGQMIDLGTLGGTQSAAYAINNGGLVTGYSAASDGSCHLFRWQNGVISDLGHLGTSDCEVWDINNGSQIIGLQQTILSQMVAFIWTGETGFTILGTFGGTEGYPYRINDSGQIVGTVWNGQYTLTGQLHLRAFSYRNGGTTNLGTLGGTRSVAKGLNNLGTVVGWSDIALTQHAFLYETSTGMRDLNTMISPTSGWTLEAATAINDAGQIVGTGRRNGQKRVFLLTPNQTDGDADGVPDACEAASPSDTDPTLPCGTGTALATTITLTGLARPWRSFSGRARKKP